MLTTLFIISLAVACVCRTIVYEEVFREFHDWCVKKSKTCKWLYERKFFYLFTCEYCLSHWVTIFFLIVTRFHLLYDGWRGYLMAFFCIPFIANVYLNIYARIKVSITSEKKEIALKDKALGDGHG